MDESKKEKIFLIEKNGLQELKEAEFGDEDQFQKMLEDYPDLISGNQIDPENPRRWLLINREVGIPGEINGNNQWSIDHFFVDQKGIPTLVEVKRSTDTRIRREVVGQMLDYAANATAYWSIENIKNIFFEYCEKNNKDAESIIAEFAEDIEDINEFWERIDLNLKAGKIRMIFIADKLPKELIRIIEFLNEQMTPAEVLGLELKYYANESVKTLVPRVFGRTSQSESKKDRLKSKQWNKENFYNELINRNSIIEKEIVEKIINKLEKSVSRMWYGQGQRTGSIVPILDKNEFSNQLFAIYTNGKIEIYFQYYKIKPPFDDIEMRKEILKKLNNIGLNLPEDKIDKRPSFSINLLKDEKILNSFIEIYNWIIDEINDNQE